MIEPGADNISGGQGVELGDCPEVVQGPELAAVPDHALAEHNDSGDQHVFDVFAEEGFLPRILCHRAFRLDLLEDRRFLEVHPDVIGDPHQQEGEQERNAPAPGVEGIIAEIGTRDDDDDERQHDTERRRGLQPAGIVAAALVRDVLGDVSDRPAILATETKPLDRCASRTE